MNWDDLKFFIMAGEAGSLTASAEISGVSIATVGRRLASLEADVGLRLFERTSRGLRLTAAGRDLMALAHQGAEKFRAFERKTVVLRSQAVSEPVTVSATEPVVSEILAPALAALGREAPAIEVDLQSSPEVVSLAGRDADIAVRLFRPSGDSLNIRRVADLHFGLFASQDYLAGREAGSVDLGTERLLGFDAAYGDIAERTWLWEHGLAGSLVATTSSTRALVNAVLHGAGIALLPQFLALDPGLVEIPGPTIATRPMYIAIHRDLKRVPRIQMVSAWVERAIIARVRDPQASPRPVPSRR